MLDRATCEKLAAAYPEAWRPDGKRRIPCLGDLYWVRPRGDGFFVVRLLPDDGWGYWAIGTEPDRYRYGWMDEDVWCPRLDQLLDLATSLAKPNRAWVDLARVRDDQPGGPWVFWGEAKWACRADGQTPEEAVAKWLLAVKE